MPPLEMDIPFHLGSDGRIVTKSDPDEQVRLHVLALINTHPEERVTVPGYGVALKNLLFDSMDNDEVATLASTQVNAAFSSWEPGIDVVKVSVDEKETENSTSVIDVAYRRRDSADSPSAANVNTAVIGPGGVVREIVRG